MTLLELEAHFMRLVDVRSQEQVETIAEADGVWFLCPKCFIQNGGRVGTHAIVCWQPKVSQDIPPIPGRWEMLGTGLHDLTLRAGSSSVQVTIGCMAHFFIENGSIRMC